MFYIDLRAIPMALGSSVCLCSLLAGFPLLILGSSSRWCLVWYRGADSSLILSLEMQLIGALMLWPLTSRAAASP